MHKIVAVSLISSGMMTLLTCPLRSQEKVESRQDPFRFEASYTGDFITNLQGGIQRGAGYLGLAKLKAGFRTQDMGLWKGGAFHINAANTHGATPSASFIGDMQIVSNIEAGNHTFLQELWYRQTLGDISITAGLQDMNRAFATSEYASIFINSSFGILPVISQNIDAPVYPLTALGISATWQISGSAIWRNALFDGGPIGFDNNPYNLRWNISASDGVLGVSEIELKMANNQGNLKIGAFSHYHKTETKGLRDIPDSLNTPTFGCYGYADQPLWTDEHRALCIFWQAGYSPSGASINDFYWGSGINITGLFSRNIKDILGIAFAHEHFNPELASETAIEITYYYQLTRCIYFQPDVQYIIHPAGTGTTLPNALVAGMRFGIEFE